MYFTPFACVWKYNFTRPFVILRTNMDFLDPKKKRAHRNRLVIGYVLMAVAIGIGTMVLLLEAFGYDLYRRDVIQNGLVFVENKPRAANIFVDGKPEGRTGKRLVLPDGEYDFRLERDGYRAWQRTFRLQGDSVERLTYPLLFPDEITPADARQYDSPPRLVTQSPDRRWAVMLRHNSLTTFDVVDLNNRENPATTITLPEGVINTALGNHSFALVEWSTDNRHVLLRHVFPGGSEFLMLDRQDPAQSFNVGQAFPLTIAQVALRDKKFDRLHILGSDNTLWLGEVGSNQLTPLESDVQAFKSHGANVLMYVTTEEDTPEGRVAVNVREGSTTYTLRELPANRQYLLDITRYDGRWYMVAAAAEEKVAYIYRNPQSQLRGETRRPAPAATIRLNDDLSHVSFSANARFIGAQSGSNFVVYDAEHDRQYRFDTKLKLPAGYKAQWMDGFRYAVVSDGKAAVFDFDGSNQHELIDSYSGFLPMFDRNNEFLYTLAPSVDVEGSAALIRASLLAPQDQ